MIKHSVCALAACLASTAMAQSVAVSVIAPATAAPGEAVNVTVRASVTGSGFGAGIFGPAGVHGFGGDVVGSGQATGSGNSINASFDRLATTGSNTGAGATRVGAGVGTDPALAGMTVDLFSYTVTMAPDASGSVELAYSGAVVLDVNGLLRTYSTNPGANQNTLTSNAATITIQTGCNPADLSEGFGTLDINDILVFAGAFNAMDPLADFSAEFGTFDINDILVFAGAFNAGCP